MGLQSSRSTTREKSLSKLDSRADSELVDLVRAGNTQAFAVLWERHAEPGKAVARGYSASHDPDDLVAEAFTKIFQSIRSGKGPTTAFRAYLFTTIRNVSASWGRSSKESSTDELDDLVDPKTLEDETLAALDRSLTASAFRSLPTRWQEALWYSEVESMTVQQIAPLLGMKANAVSALTFRAREGLRQAWIQAHISSVPDDSDCRWSIDRLGSHARGAVGPRERRRLDEHLAGCGRCSIIASEAQEVGSRLALILLPLAAGIGGAASYLTWSQTDRASSLLAAVTPSPLPASVTSSFGAGAAVSTATLSTAGLSTGTTIALVAIAALGLIGGATAIAPLFFVSAPHQSVAEPTGTDANAPALADPAHPAVEIPSTVLPPTIVDFFPPWPGNGPDLKPNPGDTPGRTPTSVPTPAPTDDPAPTATPEPTTPTTPSATPTPTSTATAPPTDPPVPPAPGAPTVGSPASGAVIGSSTVRISGTAPRADAGNTIDVSGAVSRARAMFVSTVGDDGSWSVDVGPLADGIQTLDIRQHSSRGTASKPTSVTVTIDTLALAPTFTLTDNAAGRVNPSAAGTAEPGATVTLVEAGLDVASVRADDDGVWSIDAVGTLGLGDHTLAAKQTDLVGNVSALTDEQGLTLVGVTVLSPTEGESVTESAPLLLEGVPGADFQLLIDTDLTPTAYTFDPTGRLSLTLPADLAFGTHSVGVRYTDEANGVTRFGPVLTIRITVVPTAPTVNSPTPGSSIGSNIVSIRGTVSPSDAGHVLEVSAGGVEIYTSTIGLDGSWTVDAGPLADGVHTLSIRQRASTGDASESTNLVVTTDTTALPPTFVLSGNSAGRLNPSAAGTAEPGASVVLVNGADAEIASTTADAAGAWSIDAIDTVGFGDHAIAAKQIDTLGNRSVLTELLPLTLDPVTIVSLAEGGTLTPSGAVDFAGVPGAGVQVSVDDQPVQHVFNALGTLSLNPSNGLTFGSHTLSVRYAEIDAGTTRVGPALTRQFTLVPSAPIVSTPVAGAVLGARTVRVSGVAAFASIGDIIEVSGSAGERAVGAISVDGSWVVTATLMNDGAQTLSVRHLTATGISQPTTVVVTIDTTALPPTFELSGDFAGRLNPTATGTAEPGATVVLVDEGDAELASTTADPAGDWSIDVVGNLGFGVHLIAAMQTDVVGNVSALTGRKPFTLAKIDLRSPADGTTVTRPVTLDLQGIPGTNFRLLIDGQVTPTFYSFDMWGAAAPTLANEIGYGTHDVGVRYADDVDGVTRFGPPVAVQITVVPDAPTVTSPAPGVVIDTDMVLFAGALPPTDAGHTITLFIAGQASQSIVRFDGTWSVTVGPLGDGVYTASVTQSAATGEGSAPTTFDVRVKTFPDAPAFTLTPDPNGRLFPSAAGSARPGATVELVDGQGSTIAQATADAAGAWAIDVVSGLDFGANTVAARQTDLGGRVSDLTSPVALTLAPLALTSIADGQVIQAGHLVTFQGVQDANFQFGLDGDFDGNRFEMFPLYDADGTFSIPLPDPMAFGAHRIGGRYVELVNGTPRYGPEFQVNFVLAYPPLSVASPADGDTVGSSTVRIVGGALPAGQVVDVSVSSGNVYQVVVGADERWALDAGPFADGTYTFTILQHTPDGVPLRVPNVITVTVDTVALAPTLVLAGNRGGRFVPSASGTAEPGALVEILNGGVLTDQARADAAGNWSVAALSGLGFRSHTITARQTDPAGNVSALTSPTTVSLTSVLITSLVGGKSPKGAPLDFLGVAGAPFEATLDGVATSLTLGAGGTLSSNLLGGAALGSHTLSVRYSQVVDGVTLFGPAQSISFELVPVTPKVTSPAFGATVDGNPFQITGTVPATDAGNRVQVDSFGFIVEGTVAAGGSWTVNGVQVPIDASGQGHRYTLLISQCTAAGVCSIPLPFDVVVPGW